MQSTSESYRGWAIIELFGHQRYAGYIQEVSQYGQAMLRLDIPRASAAPVPAEPVTDEADPGWLTSQFIGGAAIYRVTPTTEAIARQVAAHNTPEPVRLWELSPPVEHVPPIYEGAGVNQYSWGDAD